MMSDAALATGATTIVVAALAFVAVAIFRGRSSVGQSARSTSERFVGSIPTDRTKFEPIVGYMCKVDFECELGMADGGNRVFPSVENLKKHRKCYDQCGIVEVEVSFKSVVEPSNFWGDVA